MSPFGSTLDLIIQATHNKWIVIAMYQGHPRLMCPHLVGKANGQWKAFFFQFAGGSQKGLRPEGQWKCLHVNELSDVSVGKGEWHTGPSPKRRHKQDCVDSVVAWAPY